MHLARQISKNIKLKKAGLGFLTDIQAEAPRSFGHANRIGGEGGPAGPDSGITR